MDNKSIIAIALVAILVVAGVSAFVLVKGGGSSDVDNSLPCKLRVYGNANMDNYLDDQDIQYIDDVIDGKVIWDRVINPLADVNQDGILDDKDKDLIQNYIDGESGTMYYLDQNGERRSVPYPLTDVLGTSYGICTEFTTGIDMAYILGIDDRVTYVATSDFNPANLDTSLYPNIESVKTFGMRNPSLSTMYDDGVRLLWGDHPRGFGSYCDEAESLGFTIVKLPQNRTVNEVTALDTMITLGVMFDLQEMTKPFIEYMDKVNAIITETVKKANVHSLSYIIPYIAPAYESFWVDAHGNGPMTTADVTLIEKLPVTSKITTTAADGFESVLPETLVALNPDIYVASVFAYATDKTYTVEDYQNTFIEYMQYGFDKTTAGKNGMLFAIPFETCSLSGYASILVLASMIWPDHFDSEQAWDLMQEYYDNFTAFEGDIKDSKFAPLSYSELVN